jgi:hypothetical protein
MIEDRELEGWREQWGRAAEPSPDLRRKIQRKIKRQDRLFVLGNVMTVLAFVGLLIFAGFMRRQSSWMGTGWATAICVLVFVSTAYRVWALRGTWQAETQSTRAFLELWRRRVVARIRLLRISIYISVGWIVACAALTAANWATIGTDVKAHPRDWLELLIACVLMQPVIWYWAAWLRRRKLAELREVERILDQMKD